MIEACGRGRRNRTPFDWRGSCRRGSRHHSPTRRVFGCIRLHSPEQATFSLWRPRPSQWQRVSSGRYPRRQSVLPMPRMDSRHRAPRQRRASQRTSRRWSARSWPDCRIPLSRAAPGQQMRRSQPSPRGTCRQARSFCRGTISARTSCLPLSIWQSLKPCHRRSCRRSSCRRRCCRRPPLRSTLARPFRRPCRRQAERRFRASGRRRPRTRHPVPCPWSCRPRRRFRQALPRLRRALQQHRRGNASRRRCWSARVFRKRRTIRLRQFRREAVQDKRLSRNIFPWHRHRRRSSLPLALQSARRRRVRWSRSRRRSWRWTRPHHRLRPTCRRPQ